RIVGVRVIEVFVLVGRVLVEPQVPGNIVPEKFRPRRTGPIDRIALAYFAMQVVEAERISRSLGIRDLLEGVGRIVVISGGLRRFSRARPPVNRVRNAVWNI